MWKNCQIKKKKKRIISHVRNYNLILMSSALEPSSYTKIGLMSNSVISGKSKVNLATLLMASFTSSTSQGASHLYPSSNLDTLVLAICSSIS